MRAKTRQKNRNNSTTKRQKKYLPEKSIDKDKEL